MRFSITRVEMMENPGSEDEDSRSVLLKSNTLPTVLNLLDLFASHGPESRSAVWSPTWKTVSMKCWRRWRWRRRRTFSDLRRLRASRSSVLGLCDRSLVGLGSAIAVLNRIPGPLTGEGCAGLAGLCDPKGIAVLNRIPGPLTGEGCGDARAWRCAPWRPGSPRGRGCPDWRSAALACWGSRCAVRVAGDGVRAVSARLCSMLSGDVATCDPVGESACKQGACATNKIFS